MKKTEFVAKLFLFAERLSLCRHSKLTCSFWPVHCTISKQVLYTINLLVELQSPKFKRVSLDKTPEFPFWGLNICVDFDLRDLKKIENINKLNKRIFHNQNIDIYKIA